MSDPTPSSSEELVEELEHAAARVRTEAREKLGITGTEDVVPLLQTLRQEKASIYPLVALSSLGLANYFQGYAILALAPDISRTLGIGVATFAAISALDNLAQFVAPFPMAWLAQRKARRAMLCILTGIAWSVATLYTGFATGVVSLLVILVIDGLTSGSVVALHFPLLMDSYPPRSRIRVTSAYIALGNIGVPFVLSALLIVAMTGPLNLTWRGVFLSLGVFSFIFTAVAFRLRDPGFGRFDTERIRETVHHGHAEAASVEGAQKVELRFSEIVRRLLLIPTIRRLLAGTFVLGIFSIPLNTFVSFFLDERFGLGPTGRGFFFAGTSLSAVGALALFGKRGEAIFQKDPRKVATVSSTLLLVTVMAFGLAGLVPTFGGVVAAFIIGFAVQATLYPMFNVLALSIVDARWRPHLGALAGIAVALGGILGALFLSGVERRFGIGGTLVALVVPGAIAAAIVASSRHFVNADVDAMIGRIVEEEEIKKIESAGGHLPMLACRNVDFSYGRLQVLFDVDLTVDEGELVALLGVNGAGKSTLLKVISGIGYPSRGSVRFRGQDVTYLDAERRLRLGITQVPGGRAVFAPMSVVDNLRVYGYALARNGATLDEAIDRCFNAFPQLARRRNQPASTLSGGEQQMLGLCKALILKPQLLLIDELSLGLAPVVVGQLLDMVREINASGTAVVLVEQSVNIALSVARHAYFMERGEIRFDGPSDELIGRDDLLRAVFLEGAGRTTGR